MTWKRAQDYANLDRPCKLDDWNFCICMGRCASIDCDGYARRPKAEKGRDASQGKGVSEGS